MGGLPINSPSGSGHAVKKPSVKRPLISVAHSKKACVIWPGSKQAMIVKRPSLTNRMNYTQY